MISHFAVVEGGFPKVTERFLLSQSDVVDASVWYSNGQLGAHVTLLEGSTWDERRLKVACARELGLEYTPSSFTILAARTRAA